MIASLKKIVFFTFILFALIPNLVFAHPGNNHSNSFSSGFFHPLLGLDHLLAMIAIGFWSAQLGGKSRWILPVSFFSIFLIGGAIGLIGFKLPLVEFIVISSVLVLGALIVFTVKFPTIVSSILVSVFALFHGYAHGIELPMKNSIASYLVGISISTILLITIGFIARNSLKQLQQRLGLRFNHKTI